MSCTVRELVDELVREGPERFRELHPDPVLVREEPMADEENDEDDRNFHTVMEPASRLRATLGMRLPSIHTMAPPTVAPDPPTPRRTQSIVHPVRKRPGGAFSERIGIGRAANVDVSISLPALSKYHAYVTVPGADGDDYTLTDAASKNGTWVDGKQLEPKQSAVLTDGCSVRFGPHEMIFYTADGLCELLRRRAPKP